MREEREGGRERDRERHTHTERDRDKDRETITDQERWPGPREQHNPNGCYTGIRLGEGNLRSSSQEGEVYGRGWGEKC